MATHGSNAKLYVAKAAAPKPAVEGDWVELDLAKEGTFNSQKGEVETTNRASGMDDEFLPGHRARTYDATVTFDPDDDAVEAILDNFNADGEIRWFRERPLGTGDGLPETEFQGFVTNAPVAMPGKGDVTMTVTIRVTGAVTTSAQSSSS